MQKEIEAKFLNIDHDAIRAKLKAHGAICEQPERLMRRVVIDYPDRRMQQDTDSWVRIRDEGDKITLTYKSSTEHEFGGATEIEVEVNDYDKTIAIFLAIGMVVHTEQESKRETWTYKNVEIVLDEWPWLNPYIEIEAATEKEVMDIAAELGFLWEDAVFGSVTSAYRKQYPTITKDEHISLIPKIKFGMEMPEWFEK
jgi:adenylate cyclase class 2